KHFPTFIDASAEALPELYVSGGQIGLNVSLAPKPLAALIPATFAPLTQ
ncbi:MAG TPA: Cys-tRNA(Pro) deacylase, partial [Candidatus Spyradenecus faecavium]|nr:Cys-tRNA(Pro) deacylase [Candidatus Spyradenecus faecavium]